MKAVYKLKEVLPVSPGTIVVIEKGDDDLQWYIPLAMAIVEEYWYPEDSGLYSATIHPAVVPLVDIQRVGMLLAPDMYLDFGNEMDQEYMASYFTLSWIHVLELIDGGTRFCSQEWLVEYLSTFTTERLNREELGKELRRLNDILDHFTEFPLRQLISSATKTA